MKHSWEVASDLFWCQFHPEDLDRSGQTIIGCRCSSGKRNIRGGAAGSSVNN